jgi:S-DNA-T family DNA segregation ATPase FtsK/SpoIIIE
MNSFPLQRCITSLNNFFSRPDCHIRIIAILAALGLGFLGILLGVSIAASLFRIPGIYAVPGDFFADSYGILSFLIPVYMIYAALLLADPRYRPARIFGLSCSLAPFFTLALGFAFTRDFEARAADSPLLTLIGKVGFSFIIVFLTTMEGLIIVALGYLFFPQGPAPRPSRSRGPGAGGRWEKRGASRPLLPSPGGDLRDIGGEAVPGNEAALGNEAAPGGGPGRDGPPPPGRFQGTWFPRDIPPAGTAPLPPARRPLSRLPGELAPPAPEAFAGGWEEGAEEAEEDEAPYGGYEAGDFGDDGEDDGDETGDDGEDDGPPGLSPDLAEALSAAAENAARHTAATEKAARAALPPKKPPRRGPYSLPVEGILNQYPDGQYWIIDEATRDAAVTLKDTLEEFKIQAEVTGIRKGPVITMFEILPAPGVKLSRIVNLQDNIALRLAASSVRIVAPIPGKHAVGIEVPNKRRNIVSFREIIEGELQREGKKLEIPVVLGKDITGEAQTVDLVQTPHLLIAGATGSGKSVCVNAMILSILYQRAPAECRLILIDPKIVELKLYNDIPHLLTPVITEPKKAFQALQYCIYEMERRYACLDSMGVRDIRSYNRRIKERNIASEHMPYIVVVIDEFADLMATTGKELESTVARLAAMSRAVGIHLVLATQRPSIDVITGLIKANIPSRIAFMVASKMDSRIIIDMVGAEKLLGKGDMLYAGVVDPFPIRMQGAFISEEEVERVVEYVKTLGEPDYIDDEIFIDDDDEDPDPSLFNEGEDPLYDKALEIVMQQGKASASYIQRRLKIGYNRAARLVEEMEHHGVVGPAQGSRPRELLRGMV